ncbi:MAG TPA: DNA polymerase III subunit delta' [Bacillota bacterium]
MNRIHVIGHKEPMQALTSELKTGKVGHAYLFVGPEHVGKKTIARFLANRLLCQKPVNIAVDCECDSCRRFHKGVHPDFHTVTPIGNAIKIEQLRELQRQAHLSPVLGHNKIFFFPEAEKLTEAAGNSFLKILEEAPPRVIFLFTAVRADYILPTIRSRCQVYNLFPVPVAEMVAGLIDLGYSEEEARRAAVTSQGLPGLVLLSSTETPDNFPVFADLQQLDLLRLLKLATELEALERPLFLKLLQQWQTEVRMKLSQLRQGVETSTQNLATIIRIIEKLAEMVRMVEQNVNTRLILEDFFIYLKLEEDF